MALVSITDVQKNVLTDQAANIAMAAAAIAGAFGWSEGSTLIPTLSTFAYGLFSLLSTLHVIDISKVKS